MRDQPASGNPAICAHQRKIEGDRLANRGRHKRNQLISAPPERYAGLLDGPPDRRAWTHDRIVVVEADAHRLVRLRSRRRHQRIVRGHVPRLQRAEEQGHVSCRSRHRPDLTSNRLLADKSAVGAAIGPAIERGFESGDPAPSGRDSNATSNVGADAQGRKTDREGGPFPTRRATRRVRRTPRVLGHAEHRIARLVRKQKLRHVGATHDHAAGLAYGLYDHGVGARAQRLAVLDAQRRGVASHIEVLFDRDRQASQRTHRLAVLARNIDGARAFQRIAAHRLDEGAHARLDRHGSIDVAANDLLGGDLSSLQEIQQLHGGGMNERVVQIVGHGARILLPTRPWKQARNDVQAGPRR